MIYTAILLLIHWGISSCARVEGQEVDDCAKQVQRLYLARIAEFDSAVRRLEAEGRILISDVSSLSQFRAQFLECRK
ncbi:MAG TPA: hypothetical protein VJ508_03030, partial [Saprospiraceae bacterium]|nr:hypothetical protein [Saprospiraceae bacterium]